MRRITNSFQLFAPTEYVDEDTSPPIPGNLADVMLVLALGIMIALISLLGVKMSDVAAIATERLRQVEFDLTEGQSESAMEGDRYQDMGRVYLDTETGAYYMLADE
jgi:hypothetical protein